MRLALLFEVDSVGKTLVMSLRTRCLTDCSWTFGNNQESRFINTFMETKSMERSLSSRT